MMKFLLVAAGFPIGYGASGAYLAPGHRAEVRQLEGELSDSRIRQWSSQTAAERAEMRERAGLIEIDRLRRQLIRERELGAGQTEFGELRPVDEADRILPANVWVPGMKP